MLTFIDAPHRTSVDVCLVSLVTSGTLTDVRLAISISIASSMQWKNVV